VGEQAAGVQDFVLVITSELSDGMVNQRDGPPDWIVATYQKLVSTEVPHGQGSTAILGARGEEGPEKLKVGAVRSRITSDNISGRWRTSGRASSAQRSTTVVIAEEGTGLRKGGSEGRDSSRGGEKKEGDVRSVHCNCQSITI